MFSKTKRVLWVFTLVILIFLIFCTFLSIYISKSLLPVVEVVKPVRMAMHIDGTTVTYNTVIPTAAIQCGAENKYYVYIVRQRQGLFGVEDYATLIQVEVIASEGEYTAIDDLIISNSDDIVVSSSKSIKSEENVKVDIS